MGVQFCIKIPQHARLATLNFNIRKHFGSIVLIRTGLDHLQVVRLALILG